MASHAARAAARDFALLACEHVAEAILCCDRAGRVVYANAAAGRLLAAAPEALLGRELAELEPGARPGGRLAAARAAGSIIEECFWQPVGQPDGSTPGLPPVRVEVTSHRAAGPDGDVLVCCARSLTERDRYDAGQAEAAARYQCILDASPRQIALLDRSGQVLAANHRWREQPTAVADEESRQLFLDGRYLEACRRERDQGSGSFATFLDGFEEVLAGRREHFAYEYQRRTDARWIRSTAVQAAHGVDGVVLFREDVTEVRSAQADLAQRAAELKRLALVAERTSNAVAITDARRTITWVNRGFARLVGCRAEEPLGRDLLDYLVCGSSDATTVANLRVGLRRGLGSRCELLSRDLNGREYWSDIDVQPLTTGDGAVTGFIVVQADITKQVLLRQGLMASEQRLRVTLDHASLGIYEIDLLGDTVTYDASWARILGYAPTEIRHLAATWEELLHPDDRPWLAELVARSRARREPITTAEYRVRRKDGSWIWLRDSAGVVATDAAGAATRVVGVVLDITGRKEAEAESRRVAERLSLAAASAQLGVWDYDLAADRYQWNDRMREIYGVAGDSTADIKASFRMIHPDDYDRVNAEIRRCMAEGCDLHHQYRVIRADGELRYLECWALMHRGPDGRYTRSVGVTADVTDRTRQEQDRQQSQRLESIGQLAAGIAHEINTPTQYLGDNIRFLKDAFADIRGVLADLKALTAPTTEGITGLLDAVDSDYLATEIPRAIDQSLEGIDRVAGIVRAMKDFSHPVVERTPVDLHRAIESTIVVATNEWKYVADVATDFAPDLPPVSVLPGEFNQVILNLVVNAAHAIADIPGRDPSARGRIRVATRIEAGQAVIDISDTGCGMSEAVKARIFEPFFTTKGVGRGTGQGLAIAHHVVQRHGGAITVESAPGAGSTFTIRLPLDGATLERAP